MVSPLDGHLQRACAASVGCSFKEDLYEAAREALHLCKNVRDPDLVIVQMSTSYLEQVRKLETNILDVVRSIRDDVAQDCPLFGMGAQNIGCCSSKGEIISACTGHKTGVVDGCNVNDRAISICFASFDKGVNIQEFTLRNQGRSKSSKKRPVVFSHPERSMMIPGEAKYDCMIICGHGLSPECLIVNYREALVSGTLLLDDEPYEPGICIGRKILHQKLTGGIAFKLSKNVVVENLIVRGGTKSDLGHFEKSEEVEAQMKVAYAQYIATSEKRMTEGFATRPLFAFMNSCQARFPGWEYADYHAAGGDLERFATNLPGVPVLGHFSGGEKMPDADKRAAFSCAFNVFCEVTPLEGADLCHNDDDRK